MARFLASYGEVEPCWFNFPEKLERVALTSPYRDGDGRIVFIQVPVDETRRMSFIPDL